MIRVATSACWWAPAGLLLALLVASCGSGEIRCKIPDKGFCACGIGFNGDPHIGCDTSFMGGSICCAEAGFGEQANAECTCTSDRGDPNLPCPTGQRMVTSCEVEPRGSSSSTGGGTCPDPAFTECSSVADCACSTACGKNATNESVSYCTLPCTQDSDCDASGTWHGSGFGCNQLTGYCTQ